jgi:hypothetical protein
MRTLVGLVVSGAITLVLLAGCAEEEYRGYRYRSPTGDYCASFMALGGGGVAGYSFDFVVIHRAGERPRPSSAVLQMDHGYQVCMHWLDSQHLEIVYPASARVLKTRDSITLGRTVYVTLKRAPGSGGLGTYACSACLATTGRVSDDWRDCPPPPMPAPPRGQ